MKRLVENNRIYRDGLITTIVTDDDFMALQYKEAALSGSVIDKIGMVVSYSENVSSFYTVYTIEIRFAG